MYCPMMSEELSRAHRIVRKLPKHDKPRRVWNLKKRLLAKVLGLTPKKHK